MAKLEKKEQEKETKRKPVFKSTVDISGNSIGRIVPSLPCFISLLHLSAFPGCVRSTHPVPFFSSDY